MSRNVRVENQIKTYCDRFPSPASRASIRSELIQANGFENINRWTETTFNLRLRELQIGLKPQSIILKFQRLHRFFEWQIEKGNRKTNPIRLESLPRHRNMRAPNALTQREVEKLFGVISRPSWIGLRDRLAISLMLVHGYRISTIVELNWDDFETRTDGIYLGTSAKNGVLRVNRVRPDVRKVFEKFEQKTIASRR